MDYERVKVRLKHLAVIILDYERVKVRLKHLAVIILDYERVKVRLTAFSRNNIGLWKSKS